MPALTTWIVVPLLGGVIGYGTNALAVRMIFRPIRPVSILGFRVQGLLGKRHRELAASIGKVVGEHLVQHADVVRSFKDADLDGMLTSVLDKALEPKLAELRSLPLIGGFLTNERVAGIRDSIAQGVLRHKDVILERLEEAVERGLDVEKLVTEKIELFPIEKLESIVLSVASTELRAIEWLGGLLGVLIGIAQVLLGWGLP